MAVHIIDGGLEPVRVVFRGWREMGRGGKITERDGAFPSQNDIGASGREGGKPNWAYTNAKAELAIPLAALFHAPAGEEYEYIKPGTKTTKCIMPPIERDGDLIEGAPYGFVLMEGRCVYPTRQVRDQNNIVATISKFVPDVLQSLGVVQRDDWQSFNTGNFARGWNTKLPAYTELMFFPARDRHELVDEGAPPPSGLF